LIYKSLILRNIKKTKAKNMIDIIQQLKLRNEALFWFGLLCLALSVLFLILTKTTTTQVYGVNAFFKPFKFAASTFLYAWAMAWYIGYLPNYNSTIFNWVIIITLGLEIVYIAFKASQGSTSHFNISTSMNAILFSLMGVAATIATLATAYIGMLFFANSFPDLPDYYVWAIRFGIILFVIFAFEGFAMGGRLSHSVGAINDNSNLYILAWSMKYGDLRIAHFIGMHALQVLPIVSYYLLKNTKLTIGLSIVYGLLALLTLIQALNGKPFIKS
jgi:hypothetical protein